LIGCGSSRPAVFEEVDENIRDLQGGELVYRPDRDALREFMAIERAFGMVLEGCPGGMVRIPAGALPSKLEVAIAAFCLDVEEVTVNAYEECVRAKECPADKERGVYPEVLKVCNRGSGEQPKNCVTQKDAERFCTSLGKRLPTADEWEWAARGGDAGTTYPWGNQEPDASRLNGFGAECVNWLDDSKRWEDAVRPTPGYDSKHLRPLYTTDDGWVMTAPVGSFPKGANRWGVQDLAGNVREWTSSTSSSGKIVVRGGGYLSQVEVQVAVSSRELEEPAYRVYDIGFRCAR
jgi:formylglycine-generating enzyme required for sulfatase activity